MTGVAISKANNTEPQKAGLEKVYRLIRERLEHNDPESSYVAQLAAAGPDAVLKKIGEESTELILAAKGANRLEQIHELADVVFHLLVWMAQAGIEPKDLETELGRRFGKSGLKQK